MRRMKRMAEKPIKVVEHTGCVCPFPRNECEPSEGMVFVTCSQCGAIQRIKYYKKENEDES
jgi:RNase P subunit RPR2